MIYTIKKFKKEFPNDDTCLDYIFKTRFSGLICPRCGKSKFFRVKGLKKYACRCGYQISPLADTILHKSETKLSDWLFAVYLMSQSKHGTSAKELQRHLGTTYKTAWRIANLIRKLMREDDNKLEKIVEIDEMYVGGKRKQSKKNENKAIVMGMVQRGGKIKTKYLKEYWTPTTLKAIEDNVKWGTRVITDDGSILRKTKRLGYLQDTIIHSKKEFVRGDIHTNTIEGFWAQAKNSLKSTHKAVSQKYLQDYLNSLTFSYNSRFASLSPFEVLLSRLCQLPYGEVDKSVPLKLPVVS